MRSAKRVIYPVNGDKCVPAGRHPEGWRYTAVTRTTVAPPFRVAADGRDRFLSLYKEAAGILVVSV
jgi:hypothetical protein